jgi:hypothetical protein
MSVATPHKAISLISNSTDPRAAIWQLVGDVSKRRILTDEVLVGIFIRPEKIGRIIRPDSNVEEDVWQGKVGLVLKLGRLAFRDPETGEFWPEEDRVEVGDWVVFRVGDGWQCKVKDMPCRMIRDSNIRMVLDDNDPMSVF